MREYGKIHGSFWTSRDIRSMSEDGRTLAAYLLTTSHANMLGCFRLPVAYVCDDLGWDTERVREGFRDVFRNGFATLCEESNWVVITKFLKWNPFENPNVGKAAGKLFDQLPDHIKPLLARALKEYGKHFPIEKITPFDTVPETLPEPFSNGSGNGIETVSKGFPKAFRNPEPEPEPNQNQNQTPSAPSEKISLDAGGEWIGIPDALMARWQEAYPAIGIGAELSKAAAWVLANPKNKKSNYARFLTNWLCRAQDNAPRSGGNDHDDRPRLVL